MFGMVGYENAPKKGTNRNKKIGWTLLGLLALTAAAFIWLVAGALQDIEETAFQVSQNRKSLRSLDYVLRSRSEDGLEALQGIPLEPGQDAFLALVEVLEREGYVDFPEALFWVDRESGERIPWILVSSNLSETFSSKGPLLISPQPILPGKWIVGYAEGHVVVVKANSWRDLLDEPEKVPPDPVSSGP